MLIARDADGARWHGRYAERGFDYFCPGCGFEVTLKKGERVIHHFAHKPGADCDFATGETVRHMEMKEVIADGLGDCAELEVPVLGRRRADVLISGNGERIVVECQHSPLSVEEVERREFDYNQVGPMVWVLDSTLFFRHYRPRRDFEKAQGRVSAIVKALAGRDAPVYFLFEQSLYECWISTYDDRVTDEWGSRTVTRYVAESVERIYDPWTLEESEWGDSRFFTRERTGSHLGLTSNAQIRLL